MSRADLNMLTESYQEVSLRASSAQQIPLAFEPELLYQPDSLLKRGGKFALCSKVHGSKGRRIKQELFDVLNLDLVVRQIEKMPERDRQHFWISQATLVPWAVNRRISSIMQLNAVWVDIDIAHPPKGFDASTIPTGTPEKLASMLAFQIEEAGLPEPSYIISTGGGLCLKYLLEDAMPSAGRARWQSLQRHLIKKVADMQCFGYRWPVDYAASDASRILRVVGTNNPRWDQPCRIVWGNNKRHDFDWLADHILPYTREQAAAFKLEMQKYKQWDKNRAKAAAVGIHRRPAAADAAAVANAMMSDELARSLWCARFEFGRAVLTSRGGAAEGDRNNHFWPMANAIAYSCTSADDLTQELTSLHESYFQAGDWTRTEAMQTASTVVQRLKSKSLYKMQTSTFMNRLGVTASEKAAFGSLLGTSEHNLRRAEWDEGVMGFEKMSGLDVEAFKRETRRRQALAGSRSAELRSTTIGQDVRAKAVLMRNSGCTQVQIAAELGVRQGTVSKWLNSQF